MKSRNIQTRLARHKGQKLSQEWGLIAERLFIDEEDVKNSPVQQFGEYMAGDIKYKDINMDGIIDDQDKVPIGYPKTPEIIYGFGFSVGYKNFDLSTFFQGSAALLSGLIQGRSLLLSIPTMIMMLIKIRLLEMLFYKRLQIAIGRKRTGIRMLFGHVWLTKALIIIRKPVRGLCEMELFYV